MMDSDVDLQEEVMEHNGAVETLQKPTSCHSLAQYFKREEVPRQEKDYLLQKVRQWNFSLAEATWQDAMGLLGLRDSDISSLWIQKVFDTWQDDLNQPDWLRTAVTETILHLQYYQRGVLSAGGAVKIMEGMLAWLDKTQKELGVLSAGVKEAWRSILVVINLLSQTFDVGVSEAVYKRLKTSILKLQFNLQSKPLKEPYTRAKRAKKEQEEDRKKLSKKIKKSPKDNALTTEAIRATEKEIEQINERIETLRAELASTDYSLLKELVPVLKANLKCLSIARTRIQKWQDRSKVVNHLFDALTSASMGIIGLGVGSLVLAGAIAAVPVTCGAAVLVLIPAVAAFSGAVFTAGGELVNAGSLGLQGGMGLHYLFYKPHEHPINELFRGEVTFNLFEKLTSCYLEGDAGRETLKGGLKGKESWYLVQFLNQLLLHVGGAIGLDEAYKEQAVPHVILLLKAVYQSHSRKQSDLDKVLCKAVVYLSQALQRECGWSLLDKNKEDTWVSAYEKAGWLISDRDKSDVAIKEKYKIRLNNAIEAYETAVAKKNADESMLLPWDEWFNDKDVENLRSLCESYKNGKVPVEELRNKFNDIEAKMKTTWARLEMKTGEPLFSTWGLNEAETLLRKYDRELNDVVDLSRIMKKIQVMEKMIQEKGDKPAVEPSGKKRSTATFSIISGGEHEEPRLEGSHVSAFCGEMPGELPSLPNDNRDYVFSQVSGGKTKNASITNSSVSFFNLSAEKASEDKKKTAEEQSIPDSMIL